MCGASGIRSLKGGLCHGPPSGFFFFIFVSYSDRRPGSTKMIPAGFTIHTPEDVLIFLSQDDRPLKDYVEEFLELSSLVSWGRLHQLDIKNDGCKPYAGLCNVQLFDKYVHLLHLKTTVRRNYTQRRRCTSTRTHSPAVIDIAETMFTLQQVKFTVP